MLSCSCPDFDEDPGSWWYFPPDDFSVFEAKRRKRCCSCKELIDIGSHCLEFKRERSPFTEVEENICGCEIPIASLFMCESCGEHFLNLEAVGYCLSLLDDMRECLREYHKITGFKVIR